MSAVGKPTRMSYAQYLERESLATTKSEYLTVEHQPAALEAVVQLAKDNIEKHRVKDLIVTIERTGNYHRVTQKVFARAGFDVRLVHPFATKQYRLPADAGNKTDATDLFAQHRAAIAGFGLCEFALPEVYEQLRLTSFRRVRKTVVKIRPSR